jgi:hypothetical protein
LCYNKYRKREGKPKHKPTRKGKTMMNIFKNRKNNTTTTYTIHEVCETNSIYGDVGKVVFTTTNKEEAEAKLNTLRANNTKDFIYYQLTTR